MTASTWTDSDLRRSIRNLGLRWQARLEGNGPDRAIPWVLALILFVIFGSLSLARYRSLEVGSQLAAWMQGVWLVGEGKESFVTLTGRDLFDGQLSLIMWPIAKLATVVPAGPMLLTLQSLALALAVVPLWRIARGVLELGVESALVLGIAYGLQPELHNLNLAEFHPEALAVPAFLWAYLFSQDKHWVRFALAVVFALSTRSDLGLVVIGLGALLAVEGRTRAGRITAAGGALWTAVAIGVFNADLAGGEFVTGDAFAAYGDGPISILWGILTNPTQSLSDFLAEENFRALILLFAPWLFLPVLRLRFQLPLVLFGVFQFISDVPPGEFGNPQQDVAALAFLPIAAAFALRAVGRRSVRRVFVNGRLLGGVLFASAAFFLFASGSSLYNDPWTWGSRSVNDLDVIAAVESVNPDDSVAALERALPLLAERDVLIEFPRGLVVYKPAEPIFDSDIIIVDESDELWNDTGRFTFDQVIDAKGFSVESRFGTVSVYRRDTAE
jgi:uncharacterized membrane protein